MCFCCCKSKLREDNYEIAEGFFSDKKSDKKSDQDTRVSSISRECLNNSATTQERLERDRSVYDSRVNRQTERIPLQTEPSAESKSSPASKKYDWKVPPPPPPTPDHSKGWKMHYVDLSHTLYDATKEGVPPTEIWSLKEALEADLIGGINTDHL